MESEWRYNVARFGMADSDWLLCARGLDDPTVALVQLKSGTLQKYRRFYVGDPNQLPTPLGPITNVRGHFPYGDSVEPD